MRLFVVKNKLILTAILFLSLNSYASTCYMSLTLKDPELSGNAQLWKEFQTEVKKGKSEKEVIANLYKKYKKTKPEDLKIESQKSKTPLDVKIEKKAQIEINRLSPALRKKADDFLELAHTKEGLADIKANPGRWHFEGLKFKKDYYSVRINEGFRIMFELKNDTISVKEVNKNDIHKK